MQNVHSVQVNRHLFLKKFHKNRRVKRNEGHSILRLPWVWFTFRLFKLITLPSQIRGEWDCNSKCISLQVLPSSGFSEFSSLVLSISTKFSIQPVTLKYYEIRPSQWFNRLFYTVTLIHIWKNHPGNSSLNLQWVPVSANKHFIGSIPIIWCMRVLAHTYYIVEGQFVYLHLFSHSCPSRTPENMWNTCIIETVVVK